jgi:hypothetical protein
MLKELLGLQKRSTPLPAYAVSGPQLADFGPVRVNDLINIQNEAGGSIRIRIHTNDDPQYLTGKVENIHQGQMPSLEIDGVKLGDDVKVPRECVLVVERN